MTKQSKRRDFTTGEAATIIGVSQQAIIRLCDSGALKSWKIPGSLFRRIQYKALKEFMLRNGVPMDDLPPEAIPVPTPTNRSPVL